MTTAMLFFFWQPMYLPPYWPDLNPIVRIWLTIKARWFNNYICKSEKKLLERLDQAIWDVIDNPEKTQQTTAIGMLFYQTLYLMLLSIRIFITLAQSDT